MTVLEKLTAAAASLQAIARRVQGADAHELREISAMIRGAVSSMKRSTEARDAAMAAGQAAPK